MKVKLNVQKRLMAFSILNGIKNFSLADWKIINEGKMVLGFSEKDKKYYGIKQTEEGFIQWDPKRAAEEKEYDITASAFDLIKNELQKLDSQGKLNDDYIPLAAQLLE